jgi:hypothetical protein
MLSGKAKYLDTLFKEGRVTENNLYNAVSKDVITKKEYKSILGKEFKINKKTLVKKGKKLAHDIIVSRFRQDHQVNLFDGTKTDIPDMWDLEEERVSNYAVVKTFKQDIISATHTIESAVLNATTLEELENIEVTAHEIINNSPYTIDWETVKENL